jgi:hypothetical protein
MIVLDNNIEKLIILASGVADNSDFNKKIAQLRKTHGIPKNGFPTKNNFEDYQKWGSKEAKKKLQEEVKDIIKDHLDLHPDMLSLIFNHVLFPDTIMGQTSGHRISAKTVNGVLTCKFEFNHYLDPETLKNAISSIKQINERMPHFKPLDNVKRDIEILKLSQDKGDTLTSKTPDLEGDDKLSDEYIVSIVMPEEEDTMENLEKNKAYIRKRRSLAEARVKKLFPNTYKGCERK